MTYEWTAIYDDATELKQFEGDKENLFGDINQEKLIAFRIDEGDKHIIVDLKAGIFMVNGTVFEIPDVSYRNDLEYRLIYFRRVWQSMTVGFTNVETEKSSFIGFQTTIDGKNYKAIISEKDGAYQIRIN